MRRLLIVGAEYPNLPSVTWKDWEKANPLDYQGLLLDCRDPEMVPQISVAGVLSTLIHNGHTAYVLLPSAEKLTGKALSLIPQYHLYVEAATGRTLNLRANEPLFSKYMSVLPSHEIFYRVDLAYHGTQMPIVEGIVDNVSRSVCGRIARIYLLHPPAKKLEREAIRIIVEEFKPDTVALGSTPRPSWLDNVASQVPGATAIRDACVAKRAEIKKMELDLLSQEESLSNLESWADLLWLEGIPLQTKVGEALNLLGVHASTSDPTGHTGDLQAVEMEDLFIFEVTGSTGTIGIEKGRQLVQWVSESPNPSTAKGVLIANAFRNEPPDKRPPSTDKRIFVVELERLATRFHLSLLDVRELYRVVSLTLSGVPIEKSLIIEGLNTDGIVKFKI
jgi:hypothetical protein